MAVGVFGNPSPFLPALEVPRNLECVVLLLCLRGDVSKVMYTQFPRAAQHLYAVLHTCFKVRNH